MSTMPPNRPLRLSTGLLLGALLASPLACGDDPEASGQDIIFEVEQGTCNPGCDKLVYEFLILQETIDGEDKDYCILRSKTGSNKEGIQETPINEVNLDGHTSLGIAVRVTCEDAPTCVVCSSIKSVNNPPDSKYYMNLSPLMVPCVPTDDLAYLSVCGPDDSL